MLLVYAVFVGRKAPSTPVAILLPWRPSACCCHAGASDGTQSVMETMIRDMLALGRRTLRLLALAQELLYGSPQQPLARLCMLHYNVERSVPDTVRAVHLATGGGTRAACTPLMLVKHTTSRLGFCRPE